MSVKDWKDWYTHWDRGFSAGMVGLGVVVVICAALEWPLGGVSRPVISLAAVLWTATGLIRLYRSVSDHTLADRITTLRLGFGSGALLLLVLAEVLAPVDSGSLAYRTVFTIFVVVAVLSDFFDGRVARRMVSSRFGEDWDMQNDAAFAMILAVAAVVFVGVESWVILIGLARYLFVLAVPGSHEEVSTPRSYDLFAKAVCAVTVVSLAAVVTGGPSAAAASIALGVSLTAVMVSFGWFIYLLRRERVSATYIPAGTHASERIPTVD